MKIQKLNLKKNKKKKRGPKSLSFASFDYLLRFTYRQIEWGPTVIRCTACRTIKKHSDVSSFSISETNKNIETVAGFMRRAWAASCALNFPDIWFATEERNLNNHNNLKKQKMCKKNNKKRHDMKGE